MLGLGIGLFQNVAAVSGGVTGTTWDPAHSSGWTLSGGNLVAGASAGTKDVIFGTTSKTSGTSTVTVNSLGAGGTFIAIGFSSAGELDYPGAHTGIGYRSDGNLLINSSVESTTLPTYIAGDSVTCIRAGNTLTIQKNGTTVFGPTDVSTLYGGSPPAMFPAASDWVQTGVQITADFSGW